MRLVALCSVASTLCLPCSAEQQGDGATGTKEQLAKEAFDVKRRYDAASLASDGRWFQETLADDYVWYGPNGEVVNKAQYVKDVVSRDITWQSVEVKDMNVRVYGNTAIATGRFLGRGKCKGEPLDERQRFTSVLIKQGGRCKIIAEHLLQPRIRGSVTRASAHGG